VWSSVSDCDHTFIEDLINHCHRKNCLAAFDRAPERAIAKRLQTAVNSEQSFRIAYVIGDELKFLSMKYRGIISEGITYHTSGGGR